MFAHLVTVLVFSAGSAAAADLWPQIPSGIRPAMGCVLRLLKSNSAVRSADVYIVDDLRSAVEYAFRDRNGEDRVSDIVLLGGTYSGMSPRDKSEKAIAAGMDFLGGISEKLGSKCHIEPAFDNLMPPPKPREKWLRVELSKLH
jgi:hypothetical protein